MIMPSAADKLSRRRAFTLAELLVVIGVLALLVAIMTPPLQLARRQSQRASCGLHLQQLGLALQSAHTEHEFYPLWDDAGSPIRYTWIDLLVQRHLLGAPTGDVRSAAKGTLQPAVRVGYCPSDPMPDPINEDRHPNLLYPPNRAHSGIDYSYGISVPLAAGGWGWSAADEDDATRARRFSQEDQRAASRVLAGDATTSTIYNLSGDGFVSGIWNDVTQYDNTVAWGRHRGASRDLPANLLFQDGHVASVAYATGGQPPVNTAITFVWRPTESLHVSPEDEWGDGWQPGLAASAVEASEAAPPTRFPTEMNPAWYTAHHAWSRIVHK